MENQHSAGGLLKQINEALERRANLSLREQDLTVSQGKVLILLYCTENGSMSLTDLEKQLLCAKSTAHGLVSRLAEKGLVVSREREDDKRVRQIEITPQGRLCCEGAKEHMLRSEEMLLAPLTPSEREQFIELLMKVKNALRGENQ